MGKDKKTEIDLEAEDGFLKYAILSKEFRWSQWQ